MSTERAEAGAWKSPHVGIVDQGKADELIGCICIVTFHNVIILDIGTQSMGCSVIIVWVVFANLSLFSALTFCRRCSLEMQQVQHLSFKRAHSVSLFV